MFKFLKSKKGFTLVELMIVVVIMAILVNARKKTCIGNQREIISSVGNWLMLQSNSTISGTFYTCGGNDDPHFATTIDTGSPKDSAKVTTIGTTAITGADAGSADVATLFKTVPVCPDASNYITVTIASGSTDGKATVSTSCSAPAADGHKVPGLS